MTRRSRMMGRVVLAVILSAAWYAIVQRVEDQINPHRFPLEVVQQLNELDARAEGK